jgi:tight adherence protein B
MSAAALIRGVLLALVLLLTCSAPATAAEEASVAHVEPTEDGVQILVSVPPGLEVDLDEVTATIDGADAPAQASLATTTTEVKRTAILAMDVSKSMSGERFEAAKTAALTFLDTVPDDVYVGIVTFASEVTGAVVPTQDREEARAVIEELELTSQTHLYDGVLAAVDMAGTDGQRSVLVLSDGADTSDTELDDVTKSVTDSEVLLDVVALEQTGAAKDALQTPTRCARRSPRRPTRWPVRSWSPPSCQSPSPAMRRPSPCRCRPRTRSCKPMRSPLSVAASRRRRRPPPLPPPPRSRE